jgi:uncharacterized protein (TIGR00645 family)
MSFSQRPQKRSIIDGIGDAIYGIRWGLVPMYLLLWIAIIAYNVQFVQEIIEFLFVKSAHFPGFAMKHNDSTHYLLWILGLIDITMIGNLVVMTTVGGYSTFVKEFKLDSIAGKPRWMNGLDSSTLKIKMGMSLIGVTAIHLLKTYMEAADASWDTVAKEVLIHVVFIGTTLALSLNAKLLGGHHVTPMAEPDHSHCEPAGPNATPPAKTILHG